MSQPKNKAYSQLPIDTQKEIKTKFMEGYTSSQLAKEYGLTRQGLDWHVKKNNWKEERQLMRAELFQQFSDSKKVAFTGIYLDGTSLLRRAVQDAMKEYENTKLSIAEKLKLARQISEVIKELDKIQRLDEGQPTEIKEERPFAVEELREKLHRDPFYQEVIEDVSFKEIE